MFEISKSLLIKQMQEREKRIKNINKKNETNPYCEKLDVFNNYFV